MRKMSDSGSKRMMTWMETCLLAGTFVALSALPLAAGERTLNLPETPYSYARIDFPEHFVTNVLPDFDTTPEDNATTDAGATLGRVLFYDTRLSANDTTACASCHFQKNAFADPRQFSIGYEGRPGDRNAMSLVNLRFARTGAFWDERGGPLEQQVLMPIQSRIEMGHSLPSVVKDLSQDKRYAPLFKDAFGTAEVTSERIAKALAQFVRSIVSYQSKYDEGIAQVESVKDDFPNFSAAENRGKFLFLQNCAICHDPSRGRQTVLFTTFRTLNNGVDPDTNVPDAGAGDITYNPNEVGLFKPSSLRNVEYTAPYMHDGRFATLEDVIEHYSSGVKRHPNVSGFAIRMQFSTDDKGALVAFLKSLSDEKLISDPKFSDPWQKSGQTTAEPIVSVTQHPPALKPLSAKQREQAIAAAEGLRAGETLAWLRDQDADKNQALDQEEYVSVAKVLVQTRISPLRLAALLRASEGNTRGDEEEGGQRGRGRGRGRERPDSSGDADESPAEVALADLNGDGQLNEKEARWYRGFRRFFELRDGGRLETRLDGVMRQFELGPHKSQQARALLRDAKQKLHDKITSLETNLTKKLETSLEPDQYVLFQQSVLAGRGLAAQRSSRPGTDSPEPSAIASRQFSILDKDSSGLLETAELEQLAALLDKLQGGFGQAAPDQVDMQQFTRRVISMDSDGDGFVTAAELPERMSDVLTGDSNQDGRLDEAEVANYIRATGFIRLVDNGLYVGGGFSDVFGDGVLDTLSNGSATQCRELLGQYRNQLESLTEETVVAVYPQLKRLFPPQVAAATTSGGE